MSHPRGSHLLPPPLACPVQVSHQTPGNITHDKLSSVSSSKAPARQRAHGLVPAAGRKDATMQICDSICCVTNHIRVPPGAPHYLPHARHSQHGSVTWSWCLQPSSCSCFHSLEARLPDKLNTCLHVSTPMGPAATQQCAALGLFRAGVMFAAARPVAPAHVHRHRKRAQPVQKQVTPARSAAFQSLHNSKYSIGMISSHT